MRTVSPQTPLIPRKRPRRNVLVLAAYVVFLAALILAYARVFQYLMARYEGQPDHSFIDGIYWTITTMTTLGFGDITFLSHAGRLFSSLVTLSGFLFLLILLPFGIISVAFAPWLESLLRYRPQTRLRRTAKDHVIVCGWDPVTEALCRSLAASDTPYVVLEKDLEKVRSLDEAGVTVVFGRPTDRDALEQVRAENARVVITNLSDQDNVNVILTVASLCATPVAAVVTEPERAQLLRVAGAEHVVPLREILGNYLAVRATTCGAMSHVVDSLGELNFAEIPAYGSPFVGQSVQEAALRQKTGVSVIGIWERGRFSHAKPDTVITSNMIMLLAGTRANLEALEDLLGERATDDMIVILGFGTVGRAAAAFLRERDVPYRVVDRDASLESEPSAVKGDACQQSTLEQAGVPGARGLIVTTNDDGTNVFLTLASRHINPHMRIVARANREENVAELYAAGADFVVSHSSVGASILSNIVRGRRNIFLAEGVHVFVQPVPAVLHGRTLKDSRLRSLVGATVVGIREASGNTSLDIGPDTVLDANSALLMVGPPESELQFAKHFSGPAQKRKSQDHFPAANH